MQMYAPSVPLRPDHRNMGGPSDRTGKRSAFRPDGSRPRKRARCTPRRVSVATVELVIREKSSARARSSGPRNDASGTSEPSGDPSDQPGHRERALVLHRTDLIATELAEVTVDQQRRGHHHGEPDERDPDGEGDQEQHRASQQEPHGGEPDPTRVVRIEVGATDLLDEVRVVFSETSLDLVEDALFVIVQWHPCPPAVGDPTAITDYKEAVPKGGTLDRGRDRGRPRETAAARDPGRARSRGWP